MKSFISHFQSILLKFLVVVLGIFFILGSTGNSPVILIIGENPVTIKAGDVYVDAGATAIDYEDGDVTVITSGLDLVNTSIAGIYTVTYTATDKDGNKTVKNRIIRVIEKTVNIIQKTDRNNNEITVFIQDIYDQNKVEIKEGIDYGKPKKYRIITNNFIEITYPEEVINRQIIEVKPIVKFNTVMVYDPNENTMERIPYIINKQGYVEFREKPINGKIIFSLIFITE